MESVKELFDRVGVLETEPNVMCRVPMCSLEDPLCNIPHHINDKNELCFYGSNVIDFLGLLYKSHVPNNTNDENFKKYIQLISMGLDKLPRCLVYKTDPEAIMPQKTNESDVGYDLTIIKKAKSWLQNVTLYDTGINIAVDVGYYAEIVPRSSLSKSGYMLANSVGIIDNTYRGNLFIALMKVDPTAPDIELPFRCCQLIFRKQLFVEMLETQTNHESTSRDTGGFGSTGN